MKPIKYVFWFIILGGVVFIYYHVFNQPVDPKESHRFKKIKPGTYISFYNIDNEAKVLVNDSLVFDSGIIDDNPHLNLDIELESFLKEGKNTVKVELRNRDCNTCPATPWEIRYEFIKNYEVVDFVQESSFDERDTGGVKFEKVYEVFHHNSQ